MRPCRNQKCERHPVCRKTEGSRVGIPRPSISKSHRGATPRTTNNSIFCGHPHGQRIPTHQSSSSSRASNISRRGSFAGRLSPSMVCTRRAGATRAFRRRHHNGDLMPLGSRRANGETACLEAAPRIRAPTTRSACSRTRSPA